MGDFARELTPCPNASTKAVSGTFTSACNAPTGTTALKLGIIWQAPALKHIMEYIIKHMSQLIHPSVVDHKDIDLSWMAGRIITEVSFHEPKLWSFVFGLDARIDVECLWRVMEDGKVILTAEDHNQQFGLPNLINAATKAFELIADRQIKAAHLRDSTADLEIEFSGNMRLDIIQNSSGYESWRMLDPLGASFFAQGGGQICWWKSV